MSNFTQDWTKAKSQEEKVQVAKKYCTPLPDGFIQTLDALTTPTGSRAYAEGPYNDYDYILPSDWDKVKSLTKYIGSEKPKYIHWLYERVEDYMGILTIGIGITESDKLVNIIDIPDDAIRFGWKCATKVLQLMYSSGYHALMQHKQHRVALFHAVRNAAYHQIVLANPDKNYNSLELVETHHHLDVFKCYGCGMVVDPITAKDRDEFFNTGLCSICKKRIEERYANHPYVKSYSKTDPKTDHARTAIHLLSRYKINLENKIAELKKVIRDEQAKG
jgi:hypothetical protein